MHAQNNVIGNWDPPVQLKVDGVHAAVLPSSKVLYLPHRIDKVTGKTLSVVFDPSNPAAAQYLTVPQNYFCGGHTMLADGKVLVQWR